MSSIIITGLEMPTERESFNLTIKYNGLVFDTESGMLARQQAYMDRREAEVRHHTQVYTLDMVTAALGRMGFGEKRLRDFDKMLTEVSKDYAKLILEDGKEDK